MIKQLSLIIIFLFQISEMGKKDGPVLGRNLQKSKAQTKKGRRVAQQEGYLHTTDMQDGYDWGRLNLQVTIAIIFLVLTFKS